MWRETGSRPAGSAARALLSREFPRVRAPAELNAAATEVSAASARRNQPRIRRAVRRTAAREGENRAKAGTRETGRWRAPSGTLPRRPLRGAATVRGPPREQPRASSPRFYPKVTRLRTLPSPATRLFPPTCVGRDAKCDDFFLETVSAGFVNHRWPVFRSSLWASKASKPTLGPKNLHQLGE